MFVPLLLIALSAHEAVAGYKAEWQPVDIELHTDDGLPLENAVVQLVASARKAKFYFVDCSTGDRDGPICWVPHPVHEEVAVTGEDGTVRLLGGSRTSRSALWKNDLRFSLTTLWVKVPGWKWKDPENERTYGPACLVRITELHSECGRYSMTPAQMDRLSEEGLRCTLSVGRTRVRERISEDSVRYCEPGSR
jgi:hypothetical protein